ncbi:hypothetical protein ACFL5G_00010 [Candidatus Margulisiibacteriota bacterium]
MSELFIEENVIESVERYFKNQADKKLNKIDLDKMAENIYISKKDDPEGFRILENIAKGDGNDSDISVEDIKIALKEHYVRTLRDTGSLSIEKNFRENSYAGDQKISIVLNMKEAPIPLLKESVDKILRALCRPSEEAKFKYNIEITRTSIDTEADRQRITANTKSDISDCNAAGLAYLTLLTMQINSALGILNDAEKEYFNKLQEDLNTETSGILFWKSRANDNILTEKEIKNFKKNTAFMGAGIEGAKRRQEYSSLIFRPGFASQTILFLKKMRFSDGNALKEFQSIEFFEHILTAIKVLPKDSPILKPGTALYQIHQNRVD